MSQNRRYTTALVERIACVREAQAKQRLADALAHEREQRLLADASAARLQDTERGLMALIADDKLDLSRTALYQDLASAQQITLMDDRNALKDRKESRIECTEELTRKAHYRDGASLRARDAVRAYQLQEECKELAAMIDLWVLRGLGESSHE